jgi:hypothetical protein
LIAVCLSLLSLPAVPTVSYFFLQASSLSVPIRLIVGFRTASAFSIIAGVTIRGTSCALDTGRDSTRESKFGLSVDCRVFPW